MHKYCKHNMRLVIPGPWRKQQIVILSKSYYTLWFNLSSIPILSTTLLNEVLRSPYMSRNRSSFFVTPQTPQVLIYSHNPTSSATYSHNPRNSHTFKALRRLSRVRDPLSLQSFNIKFRRKVILVDTAISTRISNGSIITSSDRVKDLAIVAIVLHDLATDDIELYRKARGYLDELARRLNVETHHGSEGGEKGGMTDALVHGRGR